VGFRNVRAPSSAYTPVTIGVPGPPTGPGGTVTFYNLSPSAFGQAFIDNVYDNDRALDRDLQPWQRLYRRPQHPGGGNALSGAGRDPRAARGQGRVHPVVLNDGGNVDHSAAAVDGVSCLDWVWHIG
jgi:hypothetical protein